MDSTLPSLGNPWNGGWTAEIPGGFHGMGDGFHGMVDGFHSFGYMSTSIRVIGGPCWNLIQGSDNSWCTSMINIERFVEVHKFNQRYFEC